MKLHVFNPDHDEALAAGTPFYTPRQAARRLAVGLGALPVWWAAEGDAVLVDAGTERLPAMPPAVRLVTPAGLTAPFWAEVTAVEPWGWDASLCRRLRRLGCPEALLPSADRLGEWRELSGRRTAVRLLPLVRDAACGAAFVSCWCTSREALAEAVGAYGEAMVKAPWSSSGRGVFRLSAGAPPAAWQRAWHVLAAQGAVEVEPFFRRVADFAAEFEVSPSRGAVYAGLSLFTATASGAYAGNVVAPQETLRRRLEGLAEAAEPGAGRRIRHEAEAAVGRLAALLPRVTGSYAGPLGVDMMLVRLPSGPVAVHPCVEVNVRRTMGWVALQLPPHLAGRGAEGRFVVRAGGPDGGDGGELLALTAGAAGCRAAIVR